MRRIRRFLPIILVLLVLSATFYAWRARQAGVDTGPKGPVMTVTFLDASVGGGVVVRAPDGTLAVIDPGPEARGRELSRFLRGQGARALTVVLTNPSPERTGALTSLLESFRVKRIILGEVESKTETGFVGIEQARSRGIPELVMSAGDCVGLSRNVKLEVISPPKGLLKDTLPESTSNSLVARVRFGSFRLLLTSDAGVETEGHLISSGAGLASDALYVGRHEDSATTSLEFLSFVRPRYVVVAAGGAVGRPSRALLTRLAPVNTGAEVYRTDREGSVALFTDGRTVAVESERGGRE